MKRREFIEKVGNARNDYVPNERALDAVSDVELVVVVAPSAGGKDTTRRRLWLPILVSDTIRSPQVRNGAKEVKGVDYRFRGKELTKVWKDVEAGNFVQYGMGPSYSSFYGSHYTQYPKSGLVAADFMADQLAGVRKLPFKKIHSFYLVPQNIEAWQRRLTNRGTLSEDDLAHRYNEAAHSLEIGMNDHDFTVIINEDVRRAAHEIKLAIYDGVIDEEREALGRSIGATMLEQLIEIQQQVA